eukprot:scpid105469/ scgid34895/ 
MTGNSFSTFVSILAGSPAALYPYLFHNSLSPLYIYFHQEARPVQIRKTQMTAATKHRLRLSSIPHSSSPRGERGNARRTQDEGLDEVKKRKPVRATDSKCTLSVFFYFPE